MEEHAAVTAAEVARLAGVGRAAVSNWRRRYDDFPRPVSSTDSSPTFRLAEVHAWLRDQGKLGAHSLRELAWQELEASNVDVSMAEAVAAVGTYLASGSGELRATVRKAVDALATEVGNMTAFEQLCVRFGESTSRQLAVTPPDLASLMVELADVSGGPVLDPACGIGSLLCAVPTGIEVLGQVLDSSLAALTRSRLAFTHASAHIEKGDALRADAFADIKVAAVVCNPPFNERQWGFEELQYDPRWVYGIPAKGESELAWVQHCLAHLRPGGRAVIVLPPGVAVRRSGRAVRAALLRRGMLRAVVSLPPGAVSPAHLPMHLWVLAKGDDHVRLVDTCAGTPVRLDDLGWPLVRERVRRAIAGEEEPTVHRLVATIDLLDDDVDLTPARYLRHGIDLTEIGVGRERFLQLIDRVGGLLPQLDHVDGPAGRPLTTVGELVRKGALVIRQQVERMEVGSAGEIPVMMSRDVVARQGATGFLTREPPDGIHLQPGDVIVPVIAPRPVAVVVEEGVEALLGPHLQLLRADPEQLDSWFLAGYLRSCESLRVASTMSGSFRIDVRRVELPRLPIAAQRKLGIVFRELNNFAAVLGEAAELGQQLERALTNAVACGRFEPGGRIR